MSHFRHFLLVVTALLIGVVPASAQLTPDIRTEIEADMEEIRGLELLEPIQVSTISQEDYKAETIASLDTDYPPDERNQDARVLVAFGLLSPDDDLGEVYAELLGGSVAGYYDPYTQEMVVVTFGSDGEPGAFDQVTYAHETVHALQDQHFDLAALLDSEQGMSTDQSLGLRSLVEGDATVAELEYLLSDMSLARDYLEEVQDMDAGSLDELPAFLVGTLTFPYSQGYEFVQFLYDEGGWDLVNAAYEDLPASSEQVLHPQKYLDGELPIEVGVPNYSGQLGDGWQEIDRDTMGEYVISILLGESDLSGEQVEIASSGWGGDTYAVFATDDELSLVWETTWDSEKDASEFARALAIREAARLDSDVVEDGDRNLIEGDGVIVEIVQDGSNVTYRQAPTEDVLATLNEAPTTPVSSPVALGATCALAGSLRQGDDAA